MSHGGRVLVIGGTGPTGIPLLQGLVERGHTVTILHRGTHERDETPAVVEHLHADPYDEDATRAILAGRTFDVTYVMYGRLRMLAALLRGHTGRVISVGGVPAYRGWMNAWLHDPPGLPGAGRARTRQTVAEPADDEKGYRIVRTEEAVFEHHPDATHFRYPYVYGPYQLTPREWIVVRRVLDGRGRIVVADDGLTLHHHGYTENIAHALLLALEQPDAAAGKLFNIADEEVLSVRQVVEIIAAALDHEFEVVSMPYDLAVPARPLARAAAPHPPRPRRLPRRAPISATATSYRRGRPSLAPPAGCASTRSSAPPRSTRSPIRSTTRPRTGWSTRGWRRGRPSPRSTASRNRAGASRTAAPAVARGPRQSSRTEPFVN